MTEVGLIAVLITFVLFKVVKNITFKIAVKYFFGGVVLVLSAIVYSSALGKDIVDVLLFKDGRRPIYVALIFGYPLIIFGLVNIVYFIILFKNEGGKKKRA